MPIQIFWFRRDLRLQDNAGLYHSLKSGLPVLPIFIFDRHILDELEDRADRRVAFIHHCIRLLHRELNEAGGGLEVHYGYPVDVFTKLLVQHNISSVITNRDYEPYARDRDEAVKKLLSSHGIELTTYKDHVIFEKQEISKNDGSGYSVYTPFSRKWKSLLTEENTNPFTISLKGWTFVQPATEIPSLREIGFDDRHQSFGNPILDEQLLLGYDETRNFPAVKGTSQIGMHLRFGTISIRSVVQHAKSLNQTFLNELIWREFFIQMLWREPRLVNEACKKEYDRIQWLNHEMEFEKWCEGNTGYPIVDAGMRELNATGFMHNRVRMITASFLVKHLLVDWRWGESYFAGKLMDYELASNVCNWQWVAGCGCDAAPYFRIFNPSLQTKKFDPQLDYIKKWIPEFDTLAYPLPVVDHEMARQRCLQAYKKAMMSYTP